ncbi:unnamed protein product [Hymenolepis diminuta]|uniref:DSL domain-containing protein n=1 Tax=Hymenolepis diminuta TaxID=6216 RepID=A0A0R3SY85_HYMDI|nr:unnamed protein product [Hymenolepis diminuta]
MNITYYYCPAESCQDSGELLADSVQRSVQMVNDYVCILGETDKSLYHPIPFSTWPSYQGVVEYWSEKTVVRLEPQVQNWRADASYFDLIEIKDPLGNTVQQWRDVKTLEALNLSYSLIIVRQVKASDDSNGNESSKINGDDSGQKELAIQTRVVEKQKFTCPGEVKFQALSNERLPDNTTLILHFLKRKQLTTRTLKLQSDYTCTSGDSDYGHYECNEDGDIICMSGWTGPNCLTPVCNEGCAKGGIRVAPNRCTCKPGWNAESREICVARSGCEDGDCVRGEDCVCHKRFEDNRCEKATVDIGKMTTPGVSKRVANLELDGDFGPELSAVVFISIEGKIASDYLQIENIPSCSSPALAETSQSGGGLEFNKKVATPGELVTLNLNLLHGHAEGDSINGACLLSTIDVATKNFGTAANRKIDFEATIEAFNGKRIRNDPNWISNSECFSCSWN